MSSQDARQFFAYTESDEDLGKRILRMTPDEVCMMARELGYNVTTEELVGAANLLRIERATNPEYYERGEIPDVALDLIAGGAAFNGDVAPDGHEMDCAIFYHYEQWHYDNDIWCTDYLRYNPCQDPSPEIKRRWGVKGY